MGNRVQYGLKGKWTRRHKSVAISKKLFVFNVRTCMTFSYIYNKKLSTRSNAIGMRASYGLSCLAAKNKFSDLSVFTADTATSAGLDRFRTQYQSSFYDLGISEQALIATAAGFVASGGKAGTPNTSQNLILGTQYTVYYNFCDSGCSLANLRCYCLLGDQVSYDLSQDYFGFEGTEYANYFSLFTGGCQYSGSGATWNTSGNAPVTYQAGKQGVPYDWQGLPLSDVVPINSNITEQESYPQATNMFTETEENEVDGDPTQHNHKIVVDRADHTFKYVTDTFLLSPEALNTTVALTPSTAASIDSASAPFIILEYLIKT